MKRKVPGLEPLETLPIVNEGEVGVYREREEEVVKQSRCESERVQKGGGMVDERKKREKEKKKKKERKEKRGKRRPGGEGVGIKCGPKRAMARSGRWGPAEKRFSTCRGAFI